MLDCTLNKHHTGLTLWGDYGSLARLHEFIHAVVEESVAIENKEGFVLGLAYDVRKAQSGQRLKRRTTQGNDRLLQYGVEILWPVILVQVGLLRHAMGFMPTSKLGHAIIFELEHVIEMAVENALPGDATEIIEWIPRLGAISYEHLEDVLTSRCVYFINISPENRLTSLSRLLETFDPMYDYFNEHGPEKSGRIPESAFAEKEPDWPEFKW